MSQAGSPPSIPKADFSVGGVGTGARLPFSRDEMATPGADAILVHFKVVSEDEEVVRRVTAMIERQLRGQRVGERGITAIITDDSIEMSATTQQIIAARVAPLVARSLGVPESIGV